MEAAHPPIQPSVTLSPVALKGVLGLLSDWGVAVPTQSENIERLRLWRELLGGLNVQQRAAWAQTPELLYPAVQYVPPLPSSDRARALDWNGLDPDQAQHEAEKERLRALADEQAEWIKAGLIPGPTQSSTEWPAIALLHACAQLGQRIRDDEVLVARLINLRAPSLLRAALPLTTEDAWRRALVKPLCGSEGNPPLLHYLLDDQEVALLVLPRLSPDLLNLRYAKGSTILFRGSIPAQDLPHWIGAGLDPTVRNEAGQYPEECNAYRPREQTVSQLRVLNAYRTPEQAAEATWRLAVASLEHGLGQDPTTLVDERLLDSIKTPPPGVSLAQYVGGIYYVADAQRTIDRLLHWMACRLEREGLLDEWMARPGHGVELLGQFVKRALQQNGGAAKIQPILDLAHRVRITPEELVIATLACGNDPRNPISELCPSPVATMQARAWLQVVQEVVRQPTLDHPQQWLKLLPALEEPLIRQVSYYPNKAAPVVNLLAHVLSRLPRSQWDTPHLTGTLLALGVADQLSNWEEFADDCHPDTTFLADRQILSEAFEQLLDQPQAAQWWSTHGKSMEKTMEKNVPHILSRLRRAQLAELAAPTQPRPSGPARRF